MVQILHGTELSYLNTLRQNGGMIPLQSHPLLDKAAYNHAHYLDYHARIGHTQRGSDRFFTGVTPNERAWFVGYDGTIVENASSSSSPKESVDNLFSAIYHRFGFLNFEIDTIGLGACCEGKPNKLQSFVYDMTNSKLSTLCQGKPYKGSGTLYSGICKQKSFTISQSDYLRGKSHNAKQNPPFVLWPFDGATDVPTVFFEESPDPLPNCSVSGYPISISFNPTVYSKVSLLSFELYDNKHNAIEPIAILNTTNDPNHKLSPLEFAFMPRKRLELDAVYHAKVTYSADGATGTKGWSFHTYAPSQPIIEPKNPQHPYGMKSGVEYLLYLRPKSCRDINTRLHISHPAGMVVTQRFIDSNLIAIKAIGKSGQMVEIKTDAKWRFRLKVQ